MRKLPPLAQLRAFEAAARHLSFQTAASELALTPTAISHQIRRLEQYCGLPLFRRRPRPITLSPAGAALFPVVRDGLDSFADTLAVLKAPVAQRQLRVTTTNAFASKWLVPRLSLWRNAQPGIALEVIGTDAVLNLPAGEADVAVRYMNTPPPDLVAHELVRDTFVAVCSPGTLPEGEPLQSFSELRGQTLIHDYWSPADATAPTWKRWLAEASKTASDVPRMDELKHLSFREEAHAIEAALAGEGILIVSDLLVARELANRTLVRALEFTLPGYGFFVTFAPARANDNAVKAFLEWIRHVA